MVNPLSPSPRPTLHTCCAFSEFFCFIFFALSFLLILAAGVAKLVFVLYKHLGQFLSTENATLRGMGDLNKHNLSLTVNSHILSASITKESSRVFVADPVIFTLEHLDVRTSSRDTLQTAQRAKAVKMLKDAAQAFFLSIKAERGALICGSYREKG